MRRPSEQWRTQSRKSSTHSKVKGETPAGRPYSAALRAAISGPAAKQTGQQLHAGSATLILSGIDGDGGSKFASADDLTAAIVSRWPTGFDEQRFVVLTGGEPLLQVDTAVITSLHAAKFAVAVETNGTIRPPVNIDWICVSPKADAHLAITDGDELKLVFPQRGAEPERYEQMAFQHFLLQPMDGPSREANTVAAAAYCLANPKWRLTLQTHKIVGLR